MINYRVLSKTKSLSVLIILLIRLTIAFLSRRQYRSKDEVKSDYDLGSWSAVLNEKRWLKFNNLESYLTLFGRKDFQIAKIDNEIVKIKTSDYYIYRLKKINQIILNYCNGDDEICELGCGFGFNILSLRSSDNYKNLYGFDISKNAIAAAKLSSKHFNLENITFDQIDLTNPEDLNWAGIKNRTVLTYYCLEQLKHSLNSVLENIINSGVKRVIHLEPTIELLDFWSIKDLVNYLYIKRRDYLDNLITCLESLEKAGRIRIIEKKRMYYSPTPKNDPTLVVWEPI